MIPPPQREIRRAMMRIVVDRPSISVGYSAITTCAPCSVLLPGSLHRVPVKAERAPG